ncbi:MAG: M48 family metalloprotease [Planctomycetota bacterium]|jgi:predicted Zn-dependent protease
MLRKLALSILTFLLCFLAGCAINPITGEEELMLFGDDIRQDVSVGRRYAPEVEKQLGGRINNNALQNYVDSVGQRIARVSHRPSLEYHFVALDHKSVNAFALPGGYLFITRGMLEKLETEAQLAGVLAHEVVHVVARDTMNAMSNQIGMELLLAAAVMSSGTSPPRGVMTAAQVTRQIVSLQYSRDDENQADLAGLDYMVRAGYDPYATVQTMRMLEKQNRRSQIEFFSTHPLHENRIEYLMRRIQVKYPAATGFKVGKEDYRAGVLEHLSTMPPPTSDR